MATRFDSSSTKYQGVSETTEAPCTALTSVIACKTTRIFAKVKKARANGQRKVLRALKTDWEKKR